MRNIHTISLLIGFISLILSGCGQKPLEPGKPVYVTIETTMGDVTVRLYDDTPLHRDNFIKSSFAKRISTKGSCSIGSSRSS